MHVSLLDVLRIKMVDLERAKWWLHIIKMMYKKKHHPYTFYLEQN